MPLALYPEAGKKTLGDAFNYLTQNFGVLYVLAGIFALIFLLYLAFGRHRNIVFAREPGPPQFSTFSWSSMLFCGGIGTSVLYWGTVEWAHILYSAAVGHLAVVGASIAVGDELSDISLGVDWLGVLLLARHCYGVCFLLPRSDQLAFI